MTLEISALLDGTVRRLAHVDRYSSVRVTRRENVAEHSFYVAFFALAIVRDLELRKVELDHLAVLEGAICHDIDEAVVGDLRRPVADAVPGLRDALDRARSGFVAGIAKEIGVPLVGSWETHRGDDLEAKVVVLADFLCVVSYLAEELRRGNELVRGDVLEVLKILSEFDAHEDLRCYYGDSHRWLMAHIERRDDLPGDRELIAKLNGGIK